MTAPDLNNCILQFEDLGEVIPQWTSYTFHSDFMTPADGFQFSIGDGEIPQGFSGKIAPGLKISLTIDDHKICTGYIDDVHIEDTRGGGTVMSVGGRDVLGDAIDSIIDPKQIFHTTQTLETIIKEVMTPYGFTKYTVDNDANRDLISGNKYGFKVNQPSASTGKHRRHRGHSKSKAGQAIQSFSSTQSKPGPHEGAYEFCERLAKRAGLHIWAEATGEGLVIGKPNFDQDARFQIVRRRGIGRGAQNNVLSGSVGKSRKNQPSLIIAGGGGGGQDVARATNRVIMINELISRRLDGSLIPAVGQLIAKYPGAYVMGPKDIGGFDPDDVVNVVPPFALNPYPRAKPLYLYDAESRDLEQLKNFVRREMAMLQRKSLQVSYEVEGHDQSGTVWCTDCICYVDDEIGGIQEELWIESVTFTKSRGQGTRTQVGMIRPYTLNL